MTKSLTKIAATALTVALVAGSAPPNPAENPGLLY